MKKNHTCCKSMKRLIEGNKRHQNGNGRKGDVSVHHKKAPSQHPYAVIISCADSRVVPEVIFDAKPGELFVVRVAGNIASSDVIASVEYAVEYLMVPLVFVLGHEDCGAVASTISFARNRLDLGQHLNALVAEIIPAINPPDERCDHLAAAIMRNAENTRDYLEQRSEIIAKKIREKELTVCAGYYHISGKRSRKVSKLKKCNCPK